MSMAAHRPICQKVVKFGTQVKDSCMFNFTQLHVANKHALAPPTGQSFRYICAHNFWPVGPIFKNKVPLDSLDHADFNAPYDVIMRHNYYYSSFFCHGMSMAAHRTVCQKVVKFGTQVKDSCMFNFTQLHVANKHALAPPTGQSFRYICAHNFWPVGPIFNNKVPLDSLDHADFNAPYDVIMRHNWFSAIFDFVESAKKVSRVAIFDWFSWKSTQTIVRPIRTKFIEWIFQCRLCLPATDNQIWRRRRRFRCELISRECFDISK